MSIHRLNKCALGSAIGILWGCAALFIGVIGTLTDNIYIQKGLDSMYGAELPDILAVLAHTIFGLAYGFVLGYAVAFFYNLVSCCCTSHCKDKSCNCTITNCDCCCSATKATKKSTTKK